MSLIPDVAVQDSRDSSREVIGSEAARVRHKQALRLRRFGFASVFSILYVVVLAAFHTQDKIDRETLVHAGVLVFAHIGAFFCAFRTGVNLRASDPSLTGWQFLGAVATMLYVAYRAPETRLVFSAFFFVALMFGMLRRDSRRVALLASISVVLFALLSVLRYTRNGDSEMLRVDMLQCFVMAVAFPWVLFLAGHMHRMHKGLSEARVKLEDTEEQSRRDDLTGLYNRRALIAAMHESKHRADTTGQPLSICVIDIDLFKRYNDAFDHSTGDEVLRTFAQVVQEGLRTTDFFGRYGGEEFVQIMPNTMLDGALADAERLRERIGSLELPGCDAVGRLTVSIGVAEHVRNEAIEQTFARADRALYKAKQLGRNRVEC